MEEKYNQFIGVLGNDGSFTKTGFWIPEDDDDEAEIAGAVMDEEYEKYKSDESGQCKTVFYIIDNGFCTRLLAFENGRYDREIASDDFVKIKKEFLKDYIKDFDKHFDKDDDFLFVVDEIYPENNMVKIKLCNYFGPDEIPRFYVEPQKLYATAGLDLRDMMDYMRFLKEKYPEEYEVLRGINK